MKTINLRSDEYFGAECALWRAVVETAWRDAINTCKSKTAAMHRDNALAWFKISNGEFRKVCDMAGLNPSYVIRKLNESLVRLEEYTSIIENNLKENKDAVNQVTI